MDERIFDQLDQLARGARGEQRMGQHRYHRSSTEYPAHDVYENDDLCRRHAGNSKDELGAKTGTYAQNEHQHHEYNSYSRLPNIYARSGHRAAGVSQLGMRIVPSAELQDLRCHAFDADRAGESSPSPNEYPARSSRASEASKPYTSAHDKSHTTERSARQYRLPPNHVAADEHQLSNQGFQCEPRSKEGTGSITAHGKGSHTNIDPPIVQGIRLVPTRQLPDRFRAIFPFPLFNAVQSKSFSTVYHTDDNFVLSAPTGSGKTAVLELAICRLVNGFANGSFKIVYQAPTKSLCAERQRDWQAKFGPLDLQCAELTGDTEFAQLQNVQHATIIVTTPEKWDSLTRKWKDHRKLMQMVKLFLIDEVHFIREDRGATLEAIVSRMKSVGSDVRFIALSATVPNFEDIATWLGQNPMNPHVPAVRERFSEEFRPVRLQRHVCGFLGVENPFAFDKVLTQKLCEIVSRFSQRKPIIVFCFTRKSCVETAKLLAGWWATKEPGERVWSAPRNQIVTANKDLRATISSGVAFHHAGLDIQDRNNVEKGYLSGEINVICCTSTLAVGVNLPCHMVIIKGTVTYHGGPGTGYAEYSDIEIMQMLGRAGRPQFDDSALAVIMTRSDRVAYYERMISGQEILESCLHRSLIDHLNAEIGLGTVTDEYTAKRWLAGTFLYVRLKRNPNHYTLDGKAPSRNLDEQLDAFCRNSISVLKKYKLIETAPKVRSTELGDAMARYCVQFHTMKHILAMPAQAKVSEILSVVAQASEFSEVRLRSNERTIYKDLNRSMSIKFPIPVNLDLGAHKVSLIIQAVLGAVELPTDDANHKTDFISSKGIIFQHAQRLVRCIIDCQLYLEDAVSARNALMLARSIAAQVWDDSPLHLMQLENVGIVTVRKLAAAGIKTVEDIESTDARQLEAVVSRNPPWGAQLQERARAFPKLRVSLRMAGEPVIRKGALPFVRIKADIGFINDRIPEMYHRRPVYVCMLAETSDGHKVHFARTSARQLNQGKEVHFTACLASPSETIRTYVMCDEIAGTACQAILKPGIHASVFPPPNAVEETSKECPVTTAHASNTAKRRTSGERRPRNDKDSVDEFGDAGLEDVDLTMAEAGGFVDIDAFGRDTQAEEHKPKRRKTPQTTQAVEDWQPQRLPSGKWACNHACKDKTACKHLCCREGLDKMPRALKAKTGKKAADDIRVGSTQTKLSLTTSKKPTLQTSKGSIRNMQATAPRKAPESREIPQMIQPHISVRTSKLQVPLSRLHDNAAARLPTARQVRLQDSPILEESLSDYGTDAFEINALEIPHAVPETRPASRMSLPPDYSNQDNYYDDDLVMDDPVDENASSRSAEPAACNLSSDPPLYAVTRASATPPLDCPNLEIPPELPSHHRANAPATKRKSLFVVSSADSVQALDDDPGAETHPPAHNSVGALSSHRVIDRDQTADSVRDIVREQRIIDNSPLLEDIDEDMNKAGSDKKVDEVEEWFNRFLGTEHFQLVN